MFREMKAFSKPLMITAGCVSVALSLSATVSNPDNPYAVIAVRNAFSLKPPPVVAPEPPPDPVKAASNIQLNGITYYDGKKRVSLAITEAGKANKEYKTLLEGERSGPLEILEINEKDWKVKVRNAGQLAVLSFETNGNKTPSPPPPINPANPGIPLPGGIPAPAGAQPGNPGVRPAATDNMRSVPSRSLRIPPSAGTSSGISLPTNRTAVDTASTTSRPIQQNQNVSAEESVVNMALAPAVNAKAGGPPLPPLPPLPE